jgi:hypothetical protein
VYLTLLNMYLTRPTSQGVKVDLSAIVYCSIGGVAGVIFGLELVTPRLDSNYSEMYFVSIWYVPSFFTIMCI